MSRPARSRSRRPSRGRHRHRASSTSFWAADSDCAPGGRQLSAASRRRYFSSDRRRASGRAVVRLDHRGKRRTRRKRRRGSQNLPVQGVMIGVTAKVSIPMNEVWPCPELTAPMNQRLLHRLLHRRPRRLATSRGKTHGQNRVCAAAVSQRALSTAASEPVDPISPAGKLYQTITDKLLAAELDRRKALEGRAAALMTSSGAVLALIFGLSVLLTGKDMVYESLVATLLLIAAMIAFLTSAVIAIVVQVHGFEYKVMSDDALRSLARDHAEWARRADDATRAWVSKQVSTICTMRTGNSTKQKQVECSLWVQVAAIGLLASSVGVELLSRYFLEFTPC